jgi:hypothetical protein
MVTRAPIAPELVDRRDSEPVEPAPQIGLQVALASEGGHWDARIRDEMDLIGGRHQMSFRSLISLHGANSGISTRVEQK